MLLVRKRFATIYLSIALLTVAACTGQPPTNGGDAPTPGPTETATLEPTAAATPERIRLAEALVVDLAVPDAEVGAGDRVTFDLTITNVHDTEITLWFDGMAWDFAVMEGGEAVWAWSANHGTDARLHTRALAPGESFSAQEHFGYDAAWDTRPDDGGAVPLAEYQVRGMFSASIEAGPSLTWPEETVHTDPQSIFVQ